MHKFSSDKEFNSFINSLKAYVNKADLSKPLELQDYLEVQLYGVLGEHGERKEDFINYLDKNDTVKFVPGSRKDLEKALEMGIELASRLGIR